MENEMKIWWKTSEPIYVVTDDDVDLSSLEAAFQNPGGDGSYREAAFLLKREGMSEDDLQEFLTDNGRAVGAYQIAYGLNEIKAAQDRVIEEMRAAGYLG
jgi:hypothetical protein